jgi:hypothetical protein
MAGVMHGAQHDVANFFCVAIALIVVALVAHSAWDRCREMKRAADRAKRASS